MPHKPVTGLILKKYSGFYYVQDEQGVIYECKLRGKAKNQVILTGDQAVITPLDERHGILEEIRARRNELYRPRIANVNLMLIVIAYDRPEPSLMLLDRMLILTLHSGLTPVIVLNKCDLTASEKAALVMQLYPDLNVAVISISAKQRCGLEQLQPVIAGKIAVLAGPSGSGKSTLLNNLVEGLSIKTQEVSHKIGRGKHTTRHVELYPLKSGGWIADTPGFSNMDLPEDLNSRQLGTYYPEFKPYQDECRFLDCLHYREADCGVKTALEKGQVSAPRYNNYVAILEEVMKNERCYR
ncbi:MAG: ribosome small subunit-dependent GTPase A [Syntrophomonadaceae bacterium]|jgi:ribosome biogenesis GTPase